MSVILGIESSCDETGVALVADGQRVLSNLVASQIETHRKFGGVVPEIASRQHTKVISQLVDACIVEAEEVSGARDIDAVAVTQGPGLMGSLLVGVCFAKALAYGWSKPFVPVHHIEGHVFSVFLDTAKAPVFPFLALVVSGGHTQLLQCPEAHRYEIIGTTRDDAVGECFDKAARLLGLSYPGGPSIQHAAEGGNPEAYSFPRAMRGANTLDFSYSGLKTAVLYTIRKIGTFDVADMAASFQAAAIDILLIKTKQALKQTGAARLVLAGGVSANLLLRARLEAELDVPVFMPPMKYCIDNGAMIASAAESRLRHGFVGDWSVTPSAGLAL